MQANYPMRRSAFNPRPAFLAAALLALGATGAWSAADAPKGVQFKTDVKVSAPSLPVTPRVSMTTQQTATRKRVDMTIDAGPAHRKSTLLFLFDKGQLLRLDTERKTYTVTDLQPDDDELTDLAGRLARRGNRGGDAAGGEGPVTSATYRVEDKGEEKVKGETAHHYLETIAMERQGGDSRTITREVWLSSTLLPKGARERGGPGAVAKGDLELHRRLGEYVPLRMKLSVPGGTSLETTVRDITTREPEAAQLEVPSDYREVSADEMRAEKPQRQRRGGLFGRRRRL